MEGEAADNPVPPPATVGQRLRSAREAQGIDLAEIAARTRIPQRHLEAIEASNFSGLPSVTYALGFAKAYARAVGADEVDIARALRRELGENPERAAPVPTYEMEDPRRVPPSGLAWGAALVALLVIVGVALWFGTDLFRGGAPAPEPLVEASATPTPEAAAPDNAAADNALAAAPAGGQVTLVARDKVWIRVTDASGKRLFEKELAAGERYDVPADADRPHVRTGRPGDIDVLINGSRVAPLGVGVQTVDVEVSAAALQARPAPATPAAGNPAERSQPGAAAAPTGAGGADAAGNAAAGL